MTLNKVIWGTQGRIEIEIWHTGVGTRFVLYGCNENSCYFGFTEGLPTDGPQCITYTEVFLDNIKGAKDWTSCRRGRISTKEVEGRIIVKGEDIVAVFNQAQFDSLISYLADYVNKLPKTIRDNTKKFQENCWIFYDS